MRRPFKTKQEEPIPEGGEQHALTPLTIIRTETVLSKLPIHQLSKSDMVDIHISRKNGKGELDLLWTVSPNAAFGPPRQLAYRIDKLIIDRKIYELGRPIPKVILLQSLRQICRDLDINEKRGVGQVKEALYQNAGALIRTKLSYKGRDGRLKQVSGAFTRYGVFFIGDTLPGDDEKIAESVYIILNDPYWTVLNNAQQRPLDYDYLKLLKESPSAQRWYEIASYKIFAAIEHHHPEAKLLYSEYCTFSAQKRRTTHTDFVKHMYKVHKPHLANSYIRSVRYEKITDDDGQLDWVMCYIPGKRAHAQYMAFNSKKLSSGEAPEGKEGGAPEHAAPNAVSESSEPIELVQLFYKKIHGVDGATASPKSQKQARDLIAKYGFAQAQFIVTFGCDRAEVGNWKPDTFGGILTYESQALDHFTKLENARLREETKKREEWVQQQYEHYRTQEIDRIKATLSAEELAEMEASIRAEFEEEGTFPNMIGLGVRIRMNHRLEERAGVLSEEEWRAKHSSS